MMSFTRPFGRIRLAAGMLALYMTFDAIASGEDDRDRLIDMVKQHELRFSDFSVDVATFQWTGKERNTPSSVEMRRIVQSRDRSYESNYFGKTSGERQDFGFRLVASDGQVASISRTPNEVEYHIGESTRAETFQPYAVLLSILGYKGTLSKFLGEKQVGRNGMDIEIGEIDIGEEEEFANLKTQRVRGLRRVEETSQIEVFDLRLAIDYAYLPCWGRVSTGDADRPQPLVESRVNSFATVGAGIPFMREIVATTFSSAPGQPSESTTIIQMEGEFLSTLPPDQIFRLNDFSGDAIVRNYTDGVLQSQTTFHPKPVKREVWPVYVIWIVINDVALSIFIIGYMARAGFRLFSCRGTE